LALINQGQQHRKQKPNKETAGEEKGEEEQKEEEITTIKTLRTNFSAVAKFAPSVLTDKDGNAEVDVEIPHNLTRYRYSLFFSFFFRKQNKKKNKRTNKWLYLQNLGHCKHRTEILRKRRGRCNRQFAFNGTL
jgi:hypothetical protein